MTEQVSMDLQEESDWESSELQEEPGGSGVCYIKWFAPVLKALKELGGSASPREVCDRIARDLNLSEAVLNERREKSNTKKFNNEVAWARNYLVYEGFIDKSNYGVWTLTEKGNEAEITEDEAGEIIRKWNKINAERRKKKETNAKQTAEKVPEGMKADGRSDIMADDVGGNLAGVAGGESKREDINSGKTDRVSINIEGSRNAEAVYHAPKEPPKPYGEAEFLREVFMGEEHYRRICALLKRKKNIIFQGPPGVGKTFAARRLAYSIMKETDESRVKEIQFHQSYAYEDFIMGYKPDGSGFSLKKGIFYRFCKEAEKQKDRDFFFIIDEINRGNLSKVFGELLMLIEGDKRGEKHKVDLAYTGHPFYVPENVYLIGMMNTADRSLAMIDYALRRRFCFVELSPAFGLPQFHDHLIDNGLSEAMVGRINKNFISLNKDLNKDSSFGKGFCIGHSYFCSPLKNCSEDTWYEDIIRYEIAPLLEEYWFDNPEKTEGIVEELLKK